MQESYRLWNRHLEISCQPKAPLNDDSEKYSHDDGDISCWHKVRLYHLQEEVLFEAEVIAWGRVEVDLLGLVQRFEAKPVLLIPGSILHGHELRSGAVLEKSKVFTLFRMNHSVIFCHDEHQLFERLEVLRVRCVLFALHLVVDVGQEVAMGSVSLKILSITEIICLSQVVLHISGVDSSMGDDSIHGSAEDANACDIHRALGQAIDAHHHPMH
mmetsp:Transcript_96490/g.171556  ORF Transcript_96490/g.171556 Transcript_96490/m.171556 type:complete len:214 (+) Transcript_96490:169-810(+)